MNSGRSYILEGAVQVVGDRVRVNAQLIDAAVDEHFWAETYDRDFSAADLFTIQADLAVGIAKQLEIVLSSADSERAGEIPTQNTDAYVAYLTGLGIRDNLNLGRERARLAHREFRRAVEFDPEFAAAWLEIVRATGYWPMVWPDEASMLAETSAAVETIHEIAPDSYEAAMADVLYQYFALSEFESVLPILEKLEQRTPLSADALYMRGKALRRAWRLQEAYYSYLAASQLDPRHLPLRYDLLDTAILLGDCDLAEIHAKAMLAVAPDDLSTRTPAARYELQCNVDAKRAAELVAGFEEIDMPALWVARAAAVLQRDFPRAVELFSYRRRHGRLVGRHAR